jgi:hypothetical protein
VIIPSDTEHGDNEIEKLRKHLYKKKAAKRNKKAFHSNGISEVEREESFSKFVKALKWFQAKYGHLYISEKYQLPHSDEEGLDEDIRGYYLGFTLQNVRAYAQFTKEPLKSKLIAIGILPEPSPVSGNS